MKTKLITVIAMMLTCLATQPVFADLIDVGPQISTFSNNTRGFWFTAPTNFTITGLGVPTDASSANFDVAVLRFNGVPSEFPTPDFNFSTLFISRNNVGSGLLNTNIDIFSGDVIGILGSRGALNSYGANNYETDILGNDVTLTRLLMQASLDSSDPATTGVSSETNHSYFGRVLVDIDSANTVPEPSTFILLGAGLGGLALLRRKARK